MTSTAYRRGHLFGHKGLLMTAKEPEGLLLFIREPVTLIFAV